MKPEALFKPVVSDDHVLFKHNTWHDGVVHGIDDFSLPPNDSGVFLLQTFSTGQAGSCKAFLFLLLHILGRIGIYETNKKGTS